MGEERGGLFEEHMVDYQPCKKRASMWVFDLRSDMRHAYAQGCHTLSLSLSFLGIFFFSLPLLYFVSLNPAAHLCTSLLHSLPIVSQGDPPHTPR